MTTALATPESTSMTTTLTTNLPSTQQNTTNPSTKPNPGKLVSRNNLLVWRKQPRYRGSFRLPLLDDPIRDGLQLAQDPDLVLPCDSFRDSQASSPRRRRDAVAGAAAPKLKKRVSWGGVVRHEEGERPAEFSMRSIVRQVGAPPAFVVRVVDKGRRGQKRRVVGEVLLEESEGEEEEGVEEDEEEEEGEEAAVVETELDSETETVEDELDDDFGYDTLLDLVCEEAEGWVPIMVAEDEEGDDWMSLTGSWVLMGTVPEGK